MRLCSAARPGVVYGAGEHVWRSEDGGGRWTNVSSFEGRSILGSRIHDVAVDVSVVAKRRLASDLGLRLGDADQ